MKIFIQTNAYHVRLFRLFHCLRLHERCPQTRCGLPRWLFFPSVFVLIRQIRLHSLWIKGYMFTSVLYAYIGGIVLKKRLGINCGSFRWVWECFIQTTLSTVMLIWQRGNSLKLSCTSCCARKKISDIILEKNIYRYYTIMLLKSAIN